MPKISNQIFIEAIWLTLSLVSTLLFCFFLFGMNIISDTIDIHLHDTYFVIAPFHILPPIFLLATFILYFVKEFRKKFQRTLPNWILVVLGLTLVISLTFLIKVFSGLFTGGFTLYPPLSALGPDMMPEMTQDPTTKVITHSLTGVQLVIMLMLLFCVYHWGTQKHKAGS